MGLRVTVIEVWKFQAILFDFPNGKSLKAFKRHFNVMETRDLPWDENSKSLTYFKSIS